jgi:hypothetical protein
MSLYYWTTCSYHYLQQKQWLMNLKTRHRRSAGSPLLMEEPPVYRLKIAHRLVTIIGQPKGWWSFWLALPLFYRINTTRSGDAACLLCVVFLQAMMKWANNKLKGLKCTTVWFKALLVLFQDPGFGVSILKSLIFFHHLEQETEKYLWR